MNMLNYLFEILFALLITLLFVKQEKPKIYFLFLGYAFVLLSLFLQLPLKFLELELTSFFSSLALSSMFFGILAIIISELTKYFSLKRFMKTKSYKNGILFGIGWSTIESINYFSILFYSWIFSLFSLTFNATSFVDDKLPLLNFLFFFTVNLGITVLVIISIIRKKRLYLIYAITLSTVIFIGLLYLNGTAKTIFSLFFFSYSLFLLFKYRSIK